MLIRVYVLFQVTDHLKDLWIMVRDTIRKRFISENINYNDELHNEK